ncbi:MAG: hypothetical protein KJN63_08325, partial [Acidimicrobiia bacterium]|nr:hypothetical protein [Acidimicrobiia bacterium]
VFLWGVSHIIPTRNVVAGFGNITNDNRLIITMEWVAEGLSFIFVAALIGAITWSSGASDVAQAVVYRVSSGFLIAVGVWTAMTGARTAVIWFKMCPVVMAIASPLLLTASFS